MTQNAGMRTIHILRLRKANSPEQKIMGSTDRTKTSNHQLPRQRNNHVPQIEALDSVKSEKLELNYKNQKARVSP